MMEIDGSDGGGQLLRTAVTLSMCTGEAVTVENVRGNRDSPGLKHQHVTAVETAAAICGATVEGVALESETVTFDPDEPTGGRYEAAIGTAGSLTLLFDTLLPVATRLDAPLALEATGGTDVRWSPPMAYYRRVKLPTVRRFGLAATVDPHRTGFYPVGGGRATLRLWPSRLEPVSLTNPGAVDAARIYSRAATDLADAEVARRQSDAVAAALSDHDIPVVERHDSVVDSDCPGSVVVVRLDADEAVAGFDAFGERGTPAEDVGLAAAEDAVAYAENAAAVDRYLGDQLLVVLALAGGRIRIPGLTDHVAASLDLFDQAGYAIETTRAQDGSVVVSASGPESGAT
jgi:RNA 3'-terminal phosphate cyclase (ATP)